VLISIRPDLAEAILAGSKTVELRRSAISDEATLFVVYATAPVSAIVGWFESAKIQIDAPNGLWDRYGSLTGIIRSEFDGYFAGAQTGFAIEVKSTTRVEPPVPLADVPAVKRAPQSFQYLDSAAFTQITGSTADWYQQARLHSLPGD